MIAYYQEKRNQTQTVGEIVGRVNTYNCETTRTPISLTEILPKILNTPAGTKAIHETLTVVEDMRTIAQKMHEKSHWQQFNKGMYGGRRKKK
jgi:hypothetical protein